MSNENVNLEIEDVDGNKIPDKIKLNIITKSRLVYFCLGFIGGLVLGILL